MMKRHLTHCVLIGGLTAIVYVQTVGFGFAPIDDALFVFENPFVNSGLSWRNVSWAFSFRTTASHANWMPLTFLSFMLDAELGGGRAAVFHLTNVILHIANSLVLYAVLYRMTGQAARSTVVAALFAVHPLHVESVAWVTERKDVLSAFFGFGALWFYAGFSLTGRWSAYLLSLCAFTLSLLSKQTLVTLPCLLLLLDYWPLRRYATLSRADLSPVSRKGAMPDFARRDAGARLLLEKLPYFALSLLFSAIVLSAQQGAMTLTHHLAFPYRLANAAVAYVRYLEKSIWPINLSVFYPHPMQGVSVGPAVAAAALLLVVSGLCVAYRRKAPHWFTGWFWFLGTLVPMIGIVQVGEQQMADRYTYIPYVGLFLGGVWSIPDVTESRSLRTLTSAVAVIVLAACSVLTWRQASLWADGIRLIQHGLSVTRDNATLHQFLASELHLQGQSDAALIHLHESERLKPHNPELQFNWGVVLSDLGRAEEAMQRFSRALELHPGHVRAHVQLGSLLEERGELDRAYRHYRAAIESAPQSASAQYNWGRVLMRQGRYAEAADHFRSAVLEDPEHELAHAELGTALAIMNDPAGAAAQFRRALEIDPNLPQAHCNLGLLLLAGGRFEDAARHFRAALAADPEMEPAQRGLAEADAAIQSQNRPLRTGHFAD